MRWSCSQPKQEMGGGNLCWNFFWKKMNPQRGDGSRSSCAGKPRKTQCRLVFSLEEMFSEKLFFCFFLFYFKAESFLLLGSSSGWTLSSGCPLRAFAELGQMPGQPGRGPPAGAGGSRVADAPEAASHFPVHFISPGSCLNCQMCFQGLLFFDAHYKQSHEGMRCRLDSLG